MLCILYWNGIYMTTGEMTPEWSCHPVWFMYMYIYKYRYRYIILNSLPTFIAGVLSFISQADNYFLPLYILRVYLINARSFTLFQLFQTGIKLTSLTCSLYPSLEGLPLNMGFKKHNDHRFLKSSKCFGKRYMYLRVAV